MTRLDELPDDVIPPPGSYGVTLACVPANFRKRVSAALRSTGLRSKRGRYATRA
jgi:hypothetical protein